MNQTENRDFVQKTTELLQEFDGQHRESFFRKMFEMLSEVVPFKFAALFLYDPERRQVKLAAHIGRVVDLVEFVDFDLGRGFSAWVAKERKPVLVDDLHAFSRQRHEIRTFLSLPLISKAELAGVVNFGHDVAGRFTQTHLHEGMAVATLLAGVILKDRQISHLHAQNQRMEQTNRELRDAQTRQVNHEKKSAITATIVSLNHEINNPLMTISGNLQLLMDRCEDEATLRKLQVVQDQAERIAKTLQKMRALQDPRFEAYLGADDDVPMLKLGQLANTSRKRRS